MKAKPPTKKQIERRERIRELGCCVKDKGQVLHRGYTQMHHTGTNAGGRKNHDEQIPLCVFHHSEIQRLSLRVWQKEYGTEKEHLAWVAERVGE